MNKTCNYFFFFFIVLYCSCANQAVLISHVGIKPTKEIAVLSDSIYLSGYVPCLEGCEDKLYISDYNKGVYEIKSDGVVLSHFAKQGHAMDETLGNSFITSSGQDVIYVVDEAKKRYCKYENSEFASDCKFPLDFRMANLTRFFVHNDTIYASVLANNYSVIKIHKNKVLNEICPLVEGIDDKMFIYNSARHVVMGNGFFFVVGQSLPILQSYTFNGDILEDYDFSKNPDLFDCYKSFLKKETNSNVIIIPDVCYCNNKLLLLSCLYYEHSVKSTVFVFDVNNGSINHIATYDLINVPYSSITMTLNGNCALFNAKESKIDIYNLPL